MQKYLGGRKGAYSFTDGNPSQGGTREHGCSFGRYGNRADLISIQQYRGKYSIKVPPQQSKYQKTIFFVLLMNHDV